MKEVLPRLSFIIELSIKLTKVLASGNISCYSPNGVHIKDGFHVEEGGIFHAYVGTPDYLIYQPCVNNHSPIQSGGKEYTESSENSSVYDIEEDTIKDNGFLIFPNPSNGEVIIQIAESNQNYTLNIFDLTGKLVETQNFVSKPIQLTLPKGVYLVMLSTQDSNSIQKLIIQ